MQTNALMPVQFEILLIENNCLDAYTFKRVIRELNIINPIVRLNNCEQVVQRIQRNLMPSAVIVVLGASELSKNNFQFLTVLQNMVGAEGALVVATEPVALPTSLNKELRSLFVGYLRKNNLLGDVEQLFKQLGNKWRVLRVPQTMEGFSL